MYRSDLLARADLAECRNLFALACKSSRKHSRLAAWALRRYGDQGSLISGVVRDHFPDRVKNTLRQHARNVTRYGDAAWNSRPPRIRTITMRTLSQAVATRDGSGFYGPQPFKR